MYFCPLFITAVTGWLVEGPDRTFNPSAVILIGVGAAGSWEQIWYNKNKRWVHGGYTANDSGKPYASVNASVLNVRSGPGTNYSDVGDTVKSSKWVIIGCNGNWLKIWWKGAKRWIHKSYTSINGSISCNSGGTSYNLPKSRVGFVQLPRSGAGFWGSTGSYRQWARPALVYGLMRAGKTWSNSHPNHPRIGIGSMSLMNGGYLSPHKTHQTGQNADIRPVANSKYEGPLDIWSSSYSRSRTKDLITYHIKRELSTLRNVLFNDPAIYNSYSYILYYSGHHNHFHLTIN